MAFKEDIQKGDTVWLRTGSPAMSVNMMDGYAHRVECVWFENMRPQVGHYDAATLTKTKPETAEFLTLEKYEILLDSIQTLNGHHKDLGQAFSSIDTRLIQLSKTVNAANAELKRINSLLEGKGIITG